MLEEPALAVFRVALVIGAMGLIIGLMYLVRGPGAVRREAPLLALLAFGLLVIVFVVPLVERAIGGFADVLLLVLSAITLVAGILVLRRESLAAAERRREAMRRPAVRALFAAWFAFVIIATVLLLILTTDLGS